MAPELQRVTLLLNSLIHQPLCSFAWVEVLRRIVILCQDSTIYRKDKHLQKLISRRENYFSFIFTYIRET